MSTARQRTVATRSPYLVARIVAVFSNICNNRNAEPGTYRGLIHNSLKYLYSKLLDVPGTFLTMRRRRVNKPICTTITVCHGQIFAVEYGVVMAILGISDMSTQMSGVYEKGYQWPMMGIGKGVLLLTRIPCNFLYSMLITPPTNHVMDLHLQPCLVKVDHYDCVRHGLMCMW